jgi:acetylornithine deacetylase/succinyl-diaminopimelate desuccinylase-like protein
MPISCPTPTRSLAYAAISGDARVSKSAAFAFVLIAAATAASAQTRPAAPFTGPMTPDRLAFREIYKELVEINTSLSSGSCTQASEAMAARLKAGGIPAEDIRIVVAPGHEKKGNLVAKLRGSDPTAKPILLLAHLDVVEANRADWQRDPFTLVEENNFYYARGSSDDKSMAAIFVDSLIRYKKEGFRPKRDIKMALTCGEETTEDFDGVVYLLQHHKDLIDAEFALNENGNGVLDENGERIALLVQAGQKVNQAFELEVANAGGHSARPRTDNAIYQLAAGLTRLAAYEFPADLNAATKLYFAGMAKAVQGQQAADMAAIAKDPPDQAALARLSRDPFTNGLLRTTCIPTMQSAGHASNALPQRATALIDCRIKPGTPVAEVQKTLERVLADPGIKIKLWGEAGVSSPEPPLTANIMQPVQQVAAKLWPGLPVVPTQMSGADDGRYLNAAGITTYGISGLFRNPDGDGSHGLNERIPVRSLYEGRDFLHEVVRLYANQ